VHLRRLSPPEIEIHREIRLRALSEASDFLGETFADSAVQLTYYWEDFTRSVTEPDGDVMFLATEGEHIIGSTYGLLNGWQNEIGRVRGMWVDPMWRGQGIGRALLQEVFAWARERELSYLELWAPVHSEAAIALYLKAGFRKTGNFAPLPTNASLQIVEMKVRL
jgi:GNAT superfamily N-acetyltransferase